MSRIRIRQTRHNDIPALIALQTRIYPSIPPWNKHDLRTQLETFPQGQIVAENDEEGIVGCASSIMVMWDDWSDEHNWYDVTSAGTFDNHNAEGRTLYGVEVFVDAASQGQGVGHLLYEGRRQLCQAMNLKRIIVCGRLPGYQAHAQDMTAELYARKIIWGDLKDPVLSFQLREGFSYFGVMPEYIPEDTESCGHASLLVWLNEHYDANQPVRIRDDIEFSLGA